MIIHHQDNGAGFSGAHKQYWWTQPLLFQRVASSVLANIIYNILDGTAWAGTTAYSVGDRVLTAGGLYFECITAGTSGGSAPTTGSSSVITDATKANPVVVSTFNAHGFSASDEVIVRVTENLEANMTELNDRRFTVANPASDTLELSGEDGTGHTAFDTDTRHCFVGLIVADNTVEWLYLGDQDYTNIRLFGQDIGTGISDDLVGANENWAVLVWDKGSEYSMLDAGVNTVSGGVDSTRNIWITTPAGDAFSDKLAFSESLRYDDTKGAAHRFTSSSRGYRVQSNAGFTHFERFQCVSDNSTLGVVIVQASSSFVRNVIGEAVAAASTITIDIGFGAEAVNVLGIDHSTDVGDQGFKLDVGSNSAAINCGIVKPSDIAAGVGSEGFVGDSTAVVFNCFSFGFDAAFNATWHGDSDYNAGDDTTGPGANAVDNLTYTDQFEDTTVAGQDWRLKAGNGMTDQGDGGHADVPSLDIIRQVRSATPDIGPWELLAVAEANRLLLINPPRLDGGFSL